MVLFFYLFVEQVFEVGLRAIPLSVDLWLHYIAFIKAKYELDINQEESGPQIRR